MTTDNVSSEDRFKAHQSKAGKSGGRKRTPAKIAASRANIAKARQRRHNQVTGPLPEPVITNARTT